VNNVKEQWRLKPYKFLQTCCYVSLEITWIDLMGSFNGNKGRDHCIERGGKALGLRMLCS
jgi:hypothetical protein